MENENLFNYKGDSMKNEKVNESVENKTLFLNPYYLKNKQVSLTKREIEVLSLVARGQSNVSIAKILNISVHTSKMHLTNIYYKLNVKGRTQAVVKALRCNFLNISAL